MVWRLCERREQRVDGGGGQGDLCGGGVGFGEDQVALLRAC